MVYRSNWALIPCGILVTAAWLASACAPIPVPPWHPGAFRRNLDEHTPDRVVVGRNIEEVMLALGAPDAASWADRRIAYTDKFANGGVLLIGGAQTRPIMVGLRSASYQDLHVWFDVQGNVDAWRYVSQVCNWAGGIDQYAPMAGRIFSTARPGSAQAARAQSTDGCSVTVERTSPPLVN